MPEKSISEIFREWEKGIPGFLDKTVAYLMEGKIPPAKIEEEVITFLKPVLEILEAFDLRLQRLEGKQPLPDSKRG